jgi:protoporphyrinogen/coproporphyrinogen III oxidase
MEKKMRVVIIGGGITGLATAWWLHKAGIDVTVLEQEQSPGGTMRTARSDGWLIETGPNSALETTPLFQTLFDDLHLRGEVVYANALGDNRYIVRGGELYPLPMSPKNFLKSRLWSTSGKLRLLKEPFVGRATKEETIAEFVSRRLGREILDYAINPFVAGVYAGSPEHLSVRAAFPKLYALEEKYGGLITGMIRGASERKKRAEKAKDRARMFSFTNGMQTLPDSIAAALGERVLTGTVIKKIAIRGEDGEVVYEAMGKRNGENFTFGAEVIVTAVPAYAAAELVAPHNRAAADTLNEIFYPPVAEVFLGHKTEEIQRMLDGFGFLVPDREKRKILGTIWSSSLFAGRAPEGYTALTTFIGGSRQPELTKKDDADLISMTTAELAALMGVRGRPVFNRVSRWQRAIPQYHLGHLDRMDKLAQFEASHPGLFLTGNYRGGISVGDCIINSEKNAERIKQFIGKDKRQ